MIKTKKHYLLILIAWLMLTSASCGKDEPGTPPEAPGNTEPPSYGHVELRTDKSRYDPGDDVTFSIQNGTVPATFLVRYTSLGAVIGEEIVTGQGWSWTTPADDFTGYMVEVRDNSEPDDVVYATVGVDVSSDWTRFPRYGFLSDYGDLSDARIDEVISGLNKHHINGIQFYDWHNKHHMPLPLNGDVPAASWKEISSNDVYLSTVRRYIDAAHAHSMGAMFYNLVFGAWENAEDDGVHPEWYIFKDPNHSDRDFHGLSAPFLSNIYLLDPSDEGWQNYINNQHNTVYAHLGFDGFHMDQLGDRGTRYNYEGDQVDLADTYGGFVGASKAAAPGKLHVMNAVSQYGQQGIAASPVDFLYTEVWSPYDTYRDLADIIKVNDFYSGQSKNTVLAAYVNYNMSGSPGYFNTASVLMADAVIFAFGGAHLELGEHMLGSEYFPNSNLEMREDLKASLVKYYDFMTAYENLLRDGGEFNTMEMSSLDGKLNIAEWPAGQGMTAFIAREVGSRQVIHLINFEDAETMEWRDNAGVQTIPGLVSDAELTFIAEGNVQKIWAASPDMIGGASRELAFNQEGEMVSFTLPGLKYWTMIVIEY